MSHCQYKLCVHQKESWQLAQQHAISYDFKILESGAYPIDSGYPHSQGALNAQLFLIRGVLWGTFWYDFKNLELGAYPIDSGYPHSQGALNAQLFLTKWVLWGTFWYDFKILESWAYPHWLRLPPKSRSFKCTTFFD